MRLTASIVFGIVAIASLAGCAAQESPSDPYRERIEEAQSQATSQFERHVFEDGELTRAEYEEAVNRYVECMEAQSVNITPIDQTGYYIFGTSTDSNVFDSSNEQCRPGTIELIESLYVDMTMNPQNRPYNELMVECLAARGAVDDSYTTDELDDEMSRGGGITETEEYTECISNPSILPDEG